MNVSNCLHAFNLVNTQTNFVDGKTKQYFDSWSKITQDSWILKAICGYEVELGTQPIQCVNPLPIHFADIEKEQNNLEIDRFLRCDIIKPVHKSEQDEFISNIFARPKKDGCIRIILNLKQFNLNMQYHHFKMETLQTAVNLMTQNCFFGSVDISDAYYSIPIKSSDRKYFWFMHNGKKYQFTCLVMGLTTAPRVFTKVLKPVFASLRASGHISTTYIDDSYLQGETYKAC